MPINNEYCDPVRSSQCVLSFVFSSGIVTASDHYRIRAPSDPDDVVLVDDPVSDMGSENASEQRLVVSIRKLNRKAVVSKGKPDAMKETITPLQLLRVNSLSGQLAAVALRAAPKKKRNARYALVI
jgi:hypothetical protein